MDKRVLKDYPYSELYFSNVFESKKLLEFCAQQKVFIISDQALKNLYAEALLAHLKSNNIESELLFIASGEASKSRQVKATLEDNLLEKGANRQSLLIALGGGVTTDLVGFLAATFYRGIPVIYLPTSLLAMVDATLGGKTGINTKHGKNLIGTFSSPKAIFIDLNFLDSLPDKEYLSAFSEIIKHAAIADRSYFDFLEKTVKELKERNKEVLTETLLKSLEIKAFVVRKDKHEQGLREILNFGHTIAHALEVLSHYQLSHGEAVALGMMIEAKLSYCINLLDLESLERLQTLIGSFGFNGKKLTHFSLEQILSALKFDKKVKQNEICFVLLQELGKPNKTKGLYAQPFDKLKLTNVLPLCLKN